MMDIFNQALAHNMILTILMSAFFIFFWLSAITYLINLFQDNFIKNVQMVIAKAASSIMTTLGLFGTFWGLTTALSMFNINDVGTIDEFIKELKPVFSFSILGIGSAGIFMFLNLFVNSSYNKKMAKKNAENKLEHETNYENKHTETKNILSRNNVLVETSNKSLDLIQQTLAKQSGQDMQQLGQIVGSAVHQAIHQAMQQQMPAFGKVIGQSVNQVLQHQIPNLGKVISHEISQSLQQPLSELAQSIKNNNGETIRLLLQDLKDEVLIPVKTEIQKTTETTRDVIDAVNASQEVNKALIHELGNVSDSMHHFINNTRVIVATMEQSVADMKLMQSEQKTILTEFSHDLYSIHSQIIHQSIFYALKLR